MTLRNSIHLRIHRIRVPHLPPGGEANLRREIQRELNRLFTQETSATNLASQAYISIPYKSAQEAASPQLIARQIAEYIRQQAKRR